MLLVATEITAFHVVGGLLALWAVVLAALGLRLHDFPGKGAGQTIVMAITAVLMLSAVGTAIGTAKDEPKGGEKAGFKNKVSTEGSPAPDQGGTKAPQDGAGSQNPGENGQSVAPGATITKLTIAAAPSQIAFDKSALEAPKGNVRITMSNPSKVEHNVSLKGPGGLDKHGPTVQKGGNSEVEAKLNPGTYEFYCSVPGHEQTGMKGTLTVK